MPESSLSPLEKLLGGKQLPALVNLVLIAVIAWIAAGLTWQFVPAPQAAVAQNAPPRQALQASAPGRDLAGEITRHNVFGTAASKPVEQAPKIEEAPETKLNLALRGVLAYDPQAAALAIISEASGSEKVYAIGDQLPGAATLEEVLADRVILKRSGRYETLRLPEDSTPVALASPGGSASTAGALDALSPRQLRDQIVKNPMDFARKVRTIPHKQDGKLIGYKLRAREYEDVLSQYGLQPDDVVVEINGTRLDNPKESLRALRSLATARTVNATVLRDGVEMPLFVSLE